MAHQITDRQRMALLVIAESIRDRGIPPTVRELCKLMGVTSTNCATDHLKALRNKGLIEHHKLNARGMRITAAGWHALGFDEPHDDQVVRVALVHLLRALETGDQLEDAVKSARAALGLEAA
jgi:SOS-response transcriptional repressor LexA